jgi:hypothetical protein
MAIVLPSTIRHGQVHYTRDSFGVGVLVLTCVCRRFFILCKRCVLQFVIVKPLLACLTVILGLAGVYHEGSFSPAWGYLWVTILDNISITVCGSGGSGGSGGLLSFVDEQIALYFLVIFYLPISEELKPFRPIPKFLCIKTVVFFAFWYIDA